MLSRLIAARRDANGDERVIASTQTNSPSLSDDDEPDLSAAAVEYVFQANIDQLPVVADEIAACTAKDETLSQVLQHCRTHWPKEAASSPLSAFFVHRSKLSEVQGCLLFGDRVIIPAELRQRILKALHFTHPGMVRMKSLARQFVYWPRITTDIERWVRNCPDCASAAKAPPKVPLRPWPSAGAVYERLHMDFAGPCSDGFKYLVVVDAHSKWPEVIKMNATSAPFLITQLTWLFSRYGFPKEIVSDNGPPFKSSELSHFCRSRGIKQTFSPPFHPQSNGQAERFVDILKRQLKKCARDDKEWVQNSLLAYRSTPSEVLRGRTPAELFLGRPIRTVLSLVKPGSGVQKGGKVHQDRDRMCRQFDRRHGTQQRPFNIGDRVLFLNYRQNKRMWLPGEVVEGSGVVWKVWAQDLRATVTRHSNQMRLSQPIPYQERPEQQQIPRTPSPERQPSPIQEEPPQHQATPRKVRFEANLPQDTNRRNSRRSDVRHVNGSRCNG
uniref:RNA-directed DNA polymerase n=1 Tax=Globodera rostochiensis TaxID=31243 RepID=A0A914H3I8_GLORO